MQRPALDGFASGIPITLRISSTGSYYDEAGDYTNNVDKQTLFTATSQAGTLSHEPSVGDRAVLCTTGYVANNASIDGKLFNLNNTNIGAAIVALSNQNVKFTKTGGGGSTVRAGIRLEVFENDNNTKAGSERVFSTNFGATFVTYSIDGTEYPLDAVRALITKQFFWARLSITYYEEIGTIVDASVRFGGDSPSTNTVTAVGYVSKLAIHGKGFQSYAGEITSTRLGAQNRIVGNLQMFKDDLGSQGSLGIANRLTVGTASLFEQDDYQMYVKGDLGASGNVVAYVSSDERLKEEIRPLSQSLSVVQQMNPVRFRWNDSGSQMGWGKEKAYTNKGYDLGFIAQELKPILPDVVGNVDYEDSTWMGVQYEKIVPVLVGAVQEQQKQIDELKDLVKKLTEDT